MNDSQLSYDVLIIGAGPVGLATAIGLQQRGINNILVIDQTRAFRPVGQFVDLLPNGLKALRAIAESAYEAMGIPKLASEVTPKVEKYWYRKNLQGDITHAIPLSFPHWQQKYGEGRISLPWFSLQTNLRNLIDPAVIQTNHRCIEIETTPEEVIVHCHINRAELSNPFAHWDSNQKTEITEISTDSTPAQESIVIRSKLVVAADGINSTVRQILYQNSPLATWATPQYSGWSALGCLAVTSVPTELKQQLKTDYFHDQTVISLQNDALMQANPDQDLPRLILVDKGEDSLGYLLHVPVSLPQIINQSPRELLALAIELLEKADFPAVITNTILLTDLDHFFSRPYYLHPASPCDHFPLWSQNRVVLAGDAAHGMPPFSAQGANQGLEDAAYLVKAIATLVQHQQLNDLGAITTQFQNYENHRRPFLAKMQQAALENHRWTEAAWEIYNQQVYHREI
ncbi:MAG: NAD(P)/FAD-dependent oxidoreductase [Synechocystis sp.]|nr:NAD(P)/FAD-dependent oxidoreductase [Synechocystis sp.]